MKQWEAEATIHYHISGTEGETAEEAIINSFSEFDGEILSIDVIEAASSSDEEQQQTSQDKI